MGLSEWDFTVRTNKGYTKSFERFDVPGEAHELTFSCYKHQPFLKSKQTCGSARFTSHALMDKLWELVHATPSFVSVRNLQTMGHLGPKPFTSAIAWL